MKAARVGLALVPGAAWSCSRPGSSAPSRAGTRCWERPTARCSTRECCCGRSACSRRWFLCGAPCAPVGLDAWCAGRLRSSPGRSRTGSLRRSVRWTTSRPARPRTTGSTRCSSPPSPGSVPRRASRRWCGAGGPAGVAGTSGRPVTWGVAATLSSRGLAAVFFTVLYQGGVPFFYVYQRGYLLAVHVSAARGLCEFRRHSPRQTGRGSG